MKKIVSVIALVIFSAFCLGSAVNMHPPWQANGTRMTYSHSPEKYIICKTYTSAGINACIDELGADGGEVYLPEGTYAITTQIDMDVPYLKITGSGEATILELGADVNGFYIYHATTRPQGCMLSDFTFDGKNVAMSAFKALINAVDIDDLTIKNIHFKNFEEYAIYCYIGNQADDCAFVQNCIFEDSTDNSSYALWFNTQGTSSGILHASNCEFKDCDEGIYGENGILMISDCKFSNSIGYSISTSNNGPDYGNISNCFFYSGAVYDIYLNNVRNWNITTNTFIDSGNSCIYLDNGYFHNVINNIIRAPANITNAIHNKNADFCSFIGNLYDLDALDADYSIYLEGHCTYNTIIGNMFDVDIDTKQIYIDTTSTSCTVAGNSPLGSIITGTAGAWPITYFQIDGQALIRSSYHVIPDAVKTDSYVITTSDFGKVLKMNSADDKTFSLPSVGADEDGGRITLVKLGAGKVTIDAADTDYVHDSGAGDGIYAQNGAFYASITLEYNHSDTRWHIIDASGTWVTYD